MSAKGTLLAATALAVLMGAPTAQSAELKKVGEIAVPGEKLTSFDISFVDQKNGRYYLADRTNQSIDIIDAKTDKVSGQVKGFVGLKFKADGKSPNNDISGPDGVVAVGDEVWAGDGDSTVKIIDPKTMKITATIATGGKTRVDEMAYDPKDQVWIGINNAEEPPFATLVSTKPDHKIIAKIEFKDAEDGAEQPQYNAADGNFYLAIPQLGKDIKKGGVVVISPAGKIVKTLPVDNCRPNGLAIGPDDNIFLGCQAKGADGFGGGPAKQMEAEVAFLDAKSGKVTAVTGIGGTDEVAYSKKNGQYYSATSNNAGGPVLGVFDAKTLKLVQKVAISGTGAAAPHSVDVNEANGHVYHPVGVGDGKGCGCIEVYALQ